jgi:hypothetical protein
LIWVLGHRHLLTDIAINARIILLKGKGVRALDVRVAAGG